MVHKYLRNEMAYCLNAHFQPKQDPHVDWDTYRDQFYWCNATLAAMPLNDLRNLTAKLEVTKLGL